MFESDSADMCAENIPLVSMGELSGGSSMRRPVSEDPQFFQFSFQWMIIEQARYSSVV